MVHIYEFVQHYSIHRSSMELELSPHADFVELATKNVLNLQL